MGLREDKPASQVIVETVKHTEDVTKKAKPKASKAKKAKGATAEDFGIEISSPERVIFPELGLTKNDLADYYATIEPLIMVDAADRPMTVIRCPGGRTGECFFQKHDKGTFGP
ncbi:MAG TPA: hypothetical protein VNS11_04220, partial [Sphingomicrobium sp.]|nr:hypothetical protein [Sphingomicrobium sp.]